MGRSLFGETNDIPTRDRMDAIKQVSDQQAQLIVNAARHYRDAMRRYMAEQAAAMANGTTLTDLVTDNWESFQGVMQAEEVLFALLDALDDT
jgi:hypothetical protein